MNAGLENTLHPSLIYYDGDYPSRLFSKYPENFDETVELQGLKYDVEKYQQLAKQYGTSVLELCCGTGRVAIPLAMDGNLVTAVDFSGELLKQLKIKLESQETEISARIELVKQDVTILGLKKKNFDLVICAFNSLLCITDFDKQQQTLFKAAEHLRKGGLLALDLMNPLTLNLNGQASPQPFFTRKNPHTGNMYTRFAAAGKMTTDQKQKLYGWYDEIEKNGTVKRQWYEMYWRPVFRFELQLMLEKAGFAIDKIYGGHRNEPLIETSAKMFVQAVKL